MNTEYFRIFNSVQNYEYNDREHPLKASGLGPELDEKWGRCTVPQRTLRRAFEAWGGTKAQWAEACPGKGGKTRGVNSPMKWLNDPGTMTASDVEATCRLFGCTLDFLRGYARERNRLSDTPPSADEAKAIYSGLTEDQKRIVASTMLEFHWANENMHDYLRDLEVEHEEFVRLKRENEELRDKC